MASYRCAVRLVVVCVVMLSAITLAEAQDGHELEIVMHPYTFEWQPQTPLMKSAELPLTVAVDWSQNQEAWLSVTLCNFKTESGHAVEMNAASLRIEAGDGSPKKLWFSPSAFHLTRKGAIKFDIVYERAEPHESFTIDPEIITDPPPIPGVEVPD